MYGEEGVQMVEVEEIKSLVVVVVGGYERKCDDCKAKHLNSNSVNFFA